ncbi:MAG TPA: hypothetical protein VGC82_12675 [Rhodopila sp.]
MNTRSSALIGLRHFQGLAAGVHRLEALRFLHAAPQREQDQRRDHAGEQRVAPAVGADQRIELAAQDAAERRAGHHETEHPGTRQVGECLGDKGDADHELRAGADAGQKAANAEDERVRGKALQRREHRDHDHAQGQGADAADIVSDHPEGHAAKCPTEQADHAEQAADPPDVGDRRSTAQKLGQRRAQHQGKQVEVGIVDCPAEPREQQHLPLVTCDVS